jgi:hypothetical protein
MCVRVFNKDTKEYAGTPHEFAYMLAVPTNSLPVDNNYGQLIPESCLCQVDIAKACKLAGYHYEETEDFEPVISRKTQEDLVNELRKTK